MHSESIISSNLAENGSSSHSEGSSIEGGGSSMISSDSLGENGSSSHSEGSFITEEENSMISSGGSIKEGERLSTIKKVEKKINLLYNDIIKSIQGKLTDEVTGTFLGK